MTERERLLSVLNGKKPDLTPWYADLSWWYNSKIEKLGHDYKGEDGYLKFYAESKAGIYVYGPNLWKETYCEKISFINEKKDDLIISKVITPLGTIESTSKYLENSYTTARLSYFIKNPEDLKIMQYIFGNRKVSPNYEEFERIDKKWGNYGIPVALGPICVSALQKLISRWAGIEKVIEIMIEDSKLLEETIENLQNSDDEIFRIIENSPSLIVEFPENLSAEITGKNLIEKYELPYWKRRIKQLKAKGKFVGIHNDGTLRGSLNILIEAGFDFVEAVTLSPVGDMSVEEVFEICDEKIVIWGGIPGVIFSPLYCEDFFENYVKNLVLFVKNKKNFILGVADQVPPDAPQERILKVRKILEKYGR
ncbi:MAG: hypothetical protein NC906_07680 [Candidatus Omnitrophica bacterium]|nr:hypothetical protein [Candidatus Omnitrophota bacterium]